MGERAQHDRAADRIARYRGDEDRLALSGPGRRRLAGLIAVPLVSALAFLTAAAAPEERPAFRTPSFEWRLPRGFPPPAVPTDNPMTAEKVELGRHLFHEPRLSITGKYSCASCHQQEHAFTDGRAHAVGATGAVHPRSAMSLTNVAYNAAYTWANPAFASLEAQALQPLLNEHPVEMGLKGHEQQALRLLESDQRYSALFAAAFPGEADPVRLDNLARALAAFERTLISGRSAFDRLVFDDQQDALTAAQRRGMGLFFSERIGCAACHFGLNFSGPLHSELMPAAQPIFANTALYNVDGRGGYPSADPGLQSETGRPLDNGRFRVPTLRNIAVTAPYMHDGSVPTLAAVIDHYAAGGRQAPAGPARHNRLRDPRLKGFQISAAEKADLIAFLESLSDPEFLRDPRFGPP